MPEKITESQFDELVEVINTNPEKFIDLMYQYTGIVAKQCTAYQFFDAAGNFLGDNWDDSLFDILDAAEIEVV